MLSRTSKTEVVESPVVIPAPAPGGMPAPERPTWVPLGLGFVALLGLGVIWEFYPSGKLFFPRCFLYVTTGLQCPGCGVTRATHALLQGDVAAAWRLNPLWVGLLPVLAWSYLVWLVNDLGQRRWFQPLANPYGIAVLLGAIGGFGVVRNLPGWHWLGL